MKKAALWWTTVSFILFLMNYKNADHSRRSFNRLFL
ncbi:hypothetical protein ERO13_A06G130802v2 [Gossypium hirsutum]|nr:hypothetical protein ERO13_A06G130802v2 [Gossypium hirsutum]